MIAKKIKLIIYQNLKIVFVHNFLIKVDIISMISLINANNAHRYAKPVLIQAKIALHAMKNNLEY